MATREEYEAAFAAEVANVYPAIDEFEKRMGVGIGSRRLETAARVLACPVKKNPPCWQHGRVVYSVARDYVERHTGEMLFLDIGTAKGFSALMMAMAVWDAGRLDRVDIISTDVVDPFARVPRNSIADLEYPPGELLTVPELVAPYYPLPPAPIAFVGLSSAAWLAALGNFPRNRINLAFIDGKHSLAAVRADIAGIVPRQESGDVMIFDDLQIPAVREAFEELEGYYTETLTAHANRRYAIASQK